MRCGARLSGGRGRCRAWALKGKRRCKWHGGKSTGPRNWRASVGAMVAGRKRMIERRLAWGLRAPGGRPPRVPDWLRRAMIERAAQELGELDPEAVLDAPCPEFAELGDAERLAGLQRLDTAILLYWLRAPHYRSEPVIRAAWYAVQTRALRAQRGEHERDRLDELIECAARC